MTLHYINARAASPVQIFSSSKVSQASLGDIIQDDPQILDEQSANWWNIKFHLCDTKLISCCISLPAAPSSEDLVFPVSGKHIVRCLHLINGTVSIAASRF